MIGYKYPKIPKIDFKNAKIFHKIFAKKTSQENPKRSQKFPRLAAMNTNGLASIRKSMTSQKIVFFERSRRGAVSTTERHEVAATKKNGIYKPLFNNRCVELMQFKSRFGLKSAEFHLCLQAISYYKLTQIKERSLGNRSSLDPGHNLHGQVTELRAPSKEKLKSRHPFATAARKLLHNLSELGIRAAQWTNLTWGTEYSKSMSALCVYIPRVSTRPIAMSLTRTAWVKLNRLRTGVGRFGSSVHKWGLAPSAKCECGARKQTVDHIISTCPTHRVPQGIMGLTVLDDETRCWLNSITASI